LGYVIKKMLVNELSELGELCKLGKSRKANAIEKERSDKSSLGGSPEYR
jgi:hypothetical protein